MKIMVTGATGKVGTRLIPRLIQQGHQVSMLVRSEERAKMLTSLGAQPIKGDLLKTESLKDAVSGVDAVVHLAASFRGATAEEAHEVNLSGTMALAQAALDSGVARFIYTSTNLVYGVGQDRRFTEEDSPKPMSSYPKSKAASERALLHLQQTCGLGLRILRLAFVYGDGDPHLNEGLMWFRNWNPTQRIHLVHHADVAQAVMLAMNADNINGETFNVADDDPATAGDIMRILNEPIADDADKRPIDYTWQQLVDTSKIKKLLGYHPVYPTLSNAILSKAL